MFSTGEFSKIARVSKRQLQYYDEIGLFTPEYTDSQTGYRFYSARQLSDLNRILALKDLGFSLAQIRQYLDEGISEAVIETMLQRQKAQIENRIMEELQRLRRVESRLKQHAPSAPDVVVKSLNAQDVLMTDHFCTSPMDGLGFMQFLIDTLPQFIEKKYLNRMLVMLNRPDFMQENVDLQFAVYVGDNVPDTVALSEKQVMVKQELPKVATMATLIHIGDPTTSHQTYGALARWIEANHYQMAGEPREIFIGLPQALQTGDMVIEIQIPVELKSRSDFLSTTN